MRRAIYGGSFNPIHNDHIKLALTFAERFELDKVTLIPTRVTPLKDNTYIVDPKHRYQMCLLAAEGYPQLEVSDIEIRREGESYTSDTIAETTGTGSSTSSTTRPSLSLRGTSLIIML